MYETMTWLDTKKYGYGKVIYHTNTKRFIPLINVCIAAFFITLMYTTKLYSWCSVRVETKGIQLIGKKIGSVRRMYQHIGQNSNLWMVRYMTEI